MTPGDEPSITVFIPTWFGVDYLEPLLNSVLNQKIDKKFEILIYDTSSTDGTKEIIEQFAEKYDSIRWKTLTKEQYGHGRTRQQAAEDARGEFVVYLSQDAIPAHDRWLYEMVRPFEINKDIVAVMGKQDPRSNAFPLLKYEIQSVFSSFGPDNGVTLFYKDYFVVNQGQYDFISFYSDVNSAARRSILTGHIPYKDVNYAEDQLFGRDIIDAGLIKAFSPRGNVIHSNDMTLKQYAPRMFDETIGLRRSGIPVAVPSKKVVLKMTIKGIIRDTFKILRDSDYSWRRKLYWIVINPFFHIEKWKGVRRATLVSLDDTSANKYSLEHTKQSRFDSKS